MDWQSLELPDEPLLHSSLGQILIPQEANMKMACHQFPPPSCEPGLPDFSWYAIPKPEKMNTNEYKMHHMVIEYLKSL
jgi:hypothetical protein